MISRTVVWVIAMALLIGMPGHSLASVDSFYLAAIRFEGNKKTRESIMLQEMVVRPGEVATARAVERSRQGIMDLGLFQSVTANLEESDEGTVLVITVKEKFYLLPLPILTGDLANSAYSYGLEGRLDNVAGLNQRLSLTYEQETKAPDAEVPHKRVASAAYHYPRVLGTNLNFGVSAQVVDEELNVVEDGTVIGSYFADRFTGSVGVSRWLVREGPSVGWLGGASVLYRNNAYEHRSGPADVYESAKAVSVTAQLGHTDVHDHVYYTTGMAYGWAGELGTRMFGSDYEFTRNQFYLRSYNRILDANANLNWQLRMGFAHGRPFGVEAYRLGNYRNLRGYKSGVDGMTFMISNLEYHQQIDGFPALRGIAFFDVGNAYPSLMEIEPGELEAGIGMGLRWKLTFLVNVVASADIAYGFGPQEKVIYLGTSGTF